MSCCGGIHYSIALLALHSADMNLVKGCGGKPPEHDKIGCVPQFTGHDDRTAW